jgi:hypothetical protein
MIITRLFDRNIIKSLSHPNDIEEMDGCMAMENDWMTEWMGGWWVQE